MHFLFLMMPPFLLISSLLISFAINAQQICKHSTYSHGALVRGDSTKKELALVFTADEFGEGLPTILQVLGDRKVKGSFFLTGRFYRNTSFGNHIVNLKNGDHYLGPHSDDHLLYASWINRDSLLVTKDSFDTDISKNINSMLAAGVPIPTPLYFIPPYEWWNDSITRWSAARELTLINFTPGIRTNADYTWPELGTSYKSSDWIMNWVKDLANAKPNALNGAIILIHAGTDPRRKDKFYSRMHELIDFLKQKDYRMVRVDELPGIL